MKKLSAKTLLQNNYVKAFGAGFVLACIMILPFIIKGHGIFTMVDDFNYQQIPFNMLSNTSIKSGDTGWNWYTDLGSNFIGSYSFYTLGSPFFWLSLLFPASVFPYLIGPLLILKYSVASLTAYAFIQRFVQYKPYALVGALLYAFSGFQMVNLMFNHFHDVVALFPLLLIGLEELMERKRFVLYTLTVALMSTVSFFFFEGQIIYLVIYFCVRFLSYDFKKYVKAVPKCLAGGLLGMGLSGIILVPSILFTLQNPRVGAGFFSGMDALMYEKDRYLLLLKAFFMPAEVPQQISSIIRYNFMSCEIYLPLVGGVLGVAYIIFRKTWVSRLLKVSLVFALIPALNSLFSGFSTIPYFRWIYMPILILSLASALILDQKTELEPKKVKHIFIGYLAVFILMICFIAFYPWGGESGHGVYRPLAFVFLAAAAFVGILWTYMSMRLKTGKRTVYVVVLGIACFSVALGWRHIWKSQQVYADESTAKYVQNFLNVAKNVEIPEGDDYRVHIDSDLGGEIPEYLTSNLSLILQVPSVESYHSNISPSVYDFYDSMGIVRTDGVVTHIPDEQYGIFDFLSVRYELTKDPDTGEIAFVENENFLPFGLVYDYYITRSDFMSIDLSQRHKVLIKAIVVADDQEAEASTFLTKLPQDELEKLSDADYETDIQARQMSAAKDFSRDNHGFSATADVEKDTWVYFTVPYDTGWKAQVNGQDVEIIQANGFMAVPVTSGSNDIVFTYSVPGLNLGIAASIGCCVLLIGGCVCVRIYNNKNKQRKM